MARLDGIAFPVSELSPIVDHPGARDDRNPLWNLGFSMRVAVSLELSSPMCSCKARDQVLATPYPWLVHELVNGFVAHRTVGAKLGQTTGNLFGRPPASKMPAHIGPQPSVLQPGPTTSLTLATQSTLLSLCSTIGIINRRTVPPQFS